MLYPVIFKRTSTGAVQTWQQEIDDANPGQYRTISGQLDGKLVVSDWKNCEGTNLGKANERTPAQQAIFEVDANYKKKLEKDYHKSQDEIDVELIFKPMLAKEYKDYVNDLDFKGQQFSCQPKLDGVRLIIKKDGMFTRNGKAIVGCPHIFKALEVFFEAYPSLIFDGELYNHEFKADFNSLVSSIKKLKPTAEDFALSEKIIEYHIYDLPSYDDNFTNRSKILKGLLDDSQSPHLKFVATHSINSQQDVDTYYQQFLEEGYEGLMLRANAPYQNKRTKDLLKRKENIDQEFILVDLQEGKGNWAGKAKRAILRMPDSEITFGAGVMGTQEYCEEILKNKSDYIGKKATVVYQMMTPDNIPRFGRLKELARSDNE